MKPTNLFRILCFVLLAAPPVATAQTTWIVDSGGGGNYTTIQACVSAAADGDTCRVNPGTYGENVSWDGKGSIAIAVRSASGPDLTTIDGTGGSYGVLAGNTPTGSVLDGFTIRNGSSYGVSVGDGDLTIMNCKISGSGSGIAVAHAEATIKNCMISGNSAGFGGGVYGSYCDVTILNSTISNNHADDGGGVYANGNVTITNSILWGNSVNVSGPQIYVGAFYTTTVSYSDVQGGQGAVHVQPNGTLSWQTGNITLDPRFAGGGDTHLQEDSPCIDVGNNFASGLPPTDIDGDGRVLDGNGDSTATVDMGADEFVKQGCFIATAAFGTELNGKIDSLRSFRDAYLMDHSVGKALVSAYYRYSPPIAECIAEHGWLRKTVRVLLLPLVGLVSLLV